MAWLSNSLLISGVVLGSMTLQLVLAFGGSIRHRSSNRILQLLLWLSYISADVVAVYALGIMAHGSIHTRIIGVWAPLLLLHLGGPDAITAYSTVDNELWTRHLLNMLYQLSVATYVIYMSELKGHLLAAAMIILIVGGFKYAERTAALRLASYSQLVNHSKSLYTYMSHQHLSGKYKYVVMGIRKMWKSVLNPTSRRIEAVTIQNVWDYEDRQPTENYILCLAHALFKMNMRRHLNLCCYEREWDETRLFFFNEGLSGLPKEKIFTVIEIELKFMYDALFSKSSDTAFSKRGSIMRIVNISLLGLGGFFVYRGLIGRQENEEPIHEVQKMVSYIIISVALMVELLQLYRIVASDWTLVWLICSDIQHSSSNLQSLATLKNIALKLLSKLRRLRRPQYWKNSIQQYSVIDTCSSISSFKWIWKLAQKLNLTDSVTAWYIKSMPVEVEFKQFIIDQVGAKSSGGSIQSCRNRIRFSNNNLREELKPFTETDHEHLILQWHIATAICERNLDNSYRENEEIKKCVRLSRTLSNYCAYLLVSCRDFLPIHADIGKWVHLQVHSELVDFLCDSAIQDLETHKRASALGNGANLARVLLEIEMAERWRILSDLWAALLIHYASLNTKPAVHADHLTIGGEFITQVWVLLGHTGLGEQ